MRGDVYRLKPGRNPRGHEQSGLRFGVVVQSAAVPLSTWLIAPTSTVARATGFRPSVEVAGAPTLVMCEQVRVVDPEVRLGERVGRLTLSEMQAVDRALRLILDL